MNAHEIDYVIRGEEIQCVEVQLDPGESVLAEAGSFMMMDPEITMETIFGDASGSRSGLMGKLMGAGKRLLTGESLFMTVFTHSGAYGRKSVTFAAPYPGKIIPLDLKQYGGKIICQKDSFLCAAKGVSIGIEFQRKLGAGFFGGEGFIMQKMEGDGLSFVHSGGYVLERVLQPGETIKLDTGCLVAMTSSVDYDIEMVKGVKSMLFGGEGLFFATLRGPGTVWVQSLPFSRMADRILSAARGSGRKEEGSILGGLGNLLDGR
ncbi:TIGR00266 family protein [Paenibacillus albidus]|uniref:TIGR00266 family protein n=1 Tax=Paenibacillus albidus TaxID=2041023 RepID=A0A917CMQ1_9BACL|nr:TIGR00266 family protein [Paenibacillus albidus]GGF92332.1 TIGR00266 family protein [Paenibacillus albidus]